MEDILEGVEDTLGVVGDVLDDPEDPSIGMYFIWTGSASHTPSVYVGVGVISGPVLAGRICCARESEPTLATDIIMSNTSSFVKYQCS